MIITQLREGLGNQLFQYAAGRALSLRLGLPLRIDTAWYGNQKHRPLVLNKFRIQADAASDKDRVRFTREHMPLIMRKVIRRYERHLCPPERRAIYVDQRQGYQPSFARIRQPVALRGYFQSEHYFAEYAETIRSEFVPTVPLSESSQAVEHRIGHCANAVNIHIRRGDYLQPTTAHFTCSLDYYRRAIGRIRQAVSEPYFFIFSDDPEWAEANLKLGHRATIVRHNSDSPEKSFEDLWLMSKCRHHIIANSTFSWWGAWLSTHPDKIVIAPEQWFNAPRQTPYELMPDAWIRLQP